MSVSFATSIVVGMAGHRLAMPLRMLQEHRASIAHELSGESLPFALAQSQHLVGASVLGARVDCSAQIKGSSAGPFGVGKHMESRDVQRLYKLLGNSKLFVGFASSTYN